MLLIIGLILGAIVAGLVFWLRNRGIFLAWYGWLMTAIGMVLVIYMAANMSGSLTEGEGTAAWMFLLFLGLPAVILFVLTWRLALRRTSSA